MPPWPATPRIGSNRSPSAASSIQAAAAAPPRSPASTNGDTVGDCSMPATPADNRALGEMSANTMKHGKSVWDCNAMLSGLPGSAGISNTPWMIGSAEFAPSADSGYPITTAEDVHLAAISTPEANKLGTPGTVDSSFVVAGSTTSFYGSPCKAETGEEKKQKVVRRSCEIEDPFLEHNQTPVKDAAVVKTDASVGTSSPGKFSAASTPFRPRRDREIEQISSDNAQAVFPPHACVFVANLVSTSSDEQLQKSVEEVFSQFGKVYIKIKRDPRGMPFAFAQYENVEDSNKAITHGRGMMINGRACRTERAKVNRTLYLVRVLGGHISEDEARDVLTGCGDLEKIWHCSPTEKEFYRLPEGVWVTFAFFQDARDAQSQFKDHPHYRLEQPEGPYPMRLSRASPLRNNAIHNPPNMQTTVCISNLPVDINALQLRDMFTHIKGCGEVEIVSRPARSDANGYEVVAYAEFATESQAHAVCRQGFQLDDVNLRIELVDLPARSALSRLANHFGSPRGRRGAVFDGPRPSHREQCIGRAMACGMNPATILHILDGSGLVPGEQFVPPMHASAYGPPYMPSFGGAFGNSAGSSEQNSGSMFAGSTMSGATNYPFAQVPGGQFYPMIPTPFIFPGVGENGRAVPVTNEQATESN